MRPRPADYQRQYRLLSYQYAEPLSAQFQLLVMLGFCIVTTCSIALTCQLSAHYGLRVPGGYLVCMYVRQARVLVGWFSLAIKWYKVADISLFLHVAPCLHCVWRGFHQDYNSPA